MIIQFTRPILGAFPIFERVTTARSSAVTNSFRCFVKITDLCTRFIQATT